MTFGGTLGMLGTRIDRFSVIPAKAGMTNTSVTSTRSPSILKTHCRSISLHWMAT